MYCILYTGNVLAILNSSMNLVFLHCFTNSLMHNVFLVDASVDFPEQSGGRTKQENNILYWTVEQYIVKKEPVCPLLSRYGRVCKLCHSTLEWTKRKKHSYINMLIILRGNHCNTIQNSSLKWVFIFNMPHRPPGRLCQCLESDFRHSADKNVNNVQMFK